MLIGQGIAWLQNKRRDLKQRRKIEKVSEYVNLSNSSIYRQFNIELRQPQKGKVYLEVGEKSIVSGDFIFETEKGHISIGNRTYIGGGSFISRESIEIGNDVIIAWGELVYDHNSHSVYWDERKDDIERVYKDLLTAGDQIKTKNWDVVKSDPIKICDKVWIGANCTILKGVTIGEGAVVGTGSVVTHDVEPWTLVSGNPARFIKRIEKE